MDVFHLSFTCSVSFEQSCFSLSRFTLLVPSLCCRPCLSPDSSCPLASHSPFAPFASSQLSSLCSHARLPPGALMFNRTSLSTHHPALFLIPPGMTKIQLTPPAEEVEGGRGCPPSAERRGMLTSISSTDGLMSQAGLWCVAHVRAVSTKGAHRSRRSY